MSFEAAITEVKKVVEAGMFKPAGAAELANRHPREEEISIYNDGVYERPLSPYLTKAYTEIIKSGQSRFTPVSIDQLGFFELKSFDKNKALYAASSLSHVLAIPKSLLESVTEAGMFKPADAHTLANRKEEMTKHLTADQKARHAQGIYLFDELDDSAKETALDHYRYNSVDYQGWWEHDYFFQPSDQELKKAGVPDNKMLFDVDMRKVYFDTDRGSYLELAGLSVEYTDAFWNWLGIPKRMRENLDYKFTTNGYRGSSTELELSKGDWSDFTPWEMKFVERAQTKFSDFVHDQLRGLKDNEQYLTSDEQVAENIRANDYEFDEEGNVS